MKHLIIFILSLIIIFPCKGQLKQHVPNKQAQAYYLEAQRKYATYVGDKDSMRIVFNLLDKAIKADGNFYNAYSEIVAYRCQTEQYKIACKTIVKMQELYPEDIFVNLLCGALQYKTGHEKEALISYNKVIKLCDAVPEKFRKGPAYSDALSNKGIALILMDKTNEGKSILRKLYNNEDNPAIKSHYAYYINTTKKGDVLDEVIPGKWN